MPRVSAQAEVAGGAFTALFERDEIFSSLGGTRDLDALQRAE